MNKELKFSVQLDENNIPEKITWNSSEDEKTAEEVKALMISLWDPKENITKRIDLWTKDMYVEEMKLLYFQSIMTMADGLERATGEKEVAEDMRDFGKMIAEKMQLKKNS